MPRLLDAAEITRQLLDLPDWRLLDRALHASFEAPRFQAAAALVAEAAATAEEMDHHPDIDVRWKRVRFELSTHSLGGLSQLDIEFAHRLSQSAAAVGATALHEVPSRLEIAIDVLDEDAVRPFWTVGLGLQDHRLPDGERALVDLHGARPRLWFQQMSPPRTERSRTHLDLYLPQDEALPRVRAVLAAGGRLTDESHAPSWWVLADAEGNELCVCTAAPDPLPGADRG